MSTPNTIYIHPASQIDVYATTDGEGRVAYDRRKTWMSVKDRMPEPFVDVLLFDEFGIGGGAWFPYEGWITWWGVVESETVTHWMPLPQPPSEDHIESTDADTKEDT